MAGHSKWANIKHRKSAIDARRGKIFTKIARELQVASRTGGPDPSMNIRLRLVLDKARSANMTKDSIERAIARGAGMEKAEDLEEIMYEGYGPHGVAVLIEVMTENRNRTVSEIRHVFTKYGGNMASTGAVSWQFDRKGQIMVDVGAKDREEFFLTAVEAGAEDVTFSEEGMAEIITTDVDLAMVRDSLSLMGVVIEGAELTMVPQTEIELPLEESLKITTLLERLEDLDDVQQVHSNLAFTEELLNRMEVA